jgi:hypothetical protein
MNLIAGFGLTWSRTRSWFASFGRPPSNYDARGEK